MSRMQISGNSSRRQRHTVYCIKLVCWITTGLFVALQLLLMVGVLFDLLEKSIFELQLSVVSGVIMVSLNVSMIVLYCRYAGMPYISMGHYKGVKHVGFVVAYWSLAFVAKYATIPVESLNPGIKPNSGNTNTSQNQGLLTAILYFSLCLVCDLVPLMLVVDSQFIKIFTFDLIRKHKSNEDESADIENAIIMKT